MAMTAGELKAKVSSNGNGVHGKRSPKQLVEFIKKTGLKMVDFKFTDVPGTWQHTSVPADQVDEDTLLAGIGFDGSSIRGFQAIHESDMILKPDVDSAHVDTFCGVPTLSVICDVFDPIAQKLYHRDPRNIARKAEAYLRSSGIATTAYFGPEAEFHYFDRVSYENSPNRAYYEIDSNEAHWNSGREQGSLGYTLRPKEGYFPAGPADTTADVRAATALVLKEWGIDVEMQHHEVGAPGQAEIDFRFDSLLKTADNLMTFKYVVRSVAARHGKSVTFMPKPVFGDNGSGMHVHQSLWNEGDPLFYDKDGYAECSQTMLYYIGGLLTHIDSLMAFCAPTTNSYKRLVPHYEAPVNVAFSARNRSAAIRIPMFFQGNPKAKRLEFRPPDPTANPYLAFSALLCAGLDGIKRKIDPVAAGFGPLEENIYDLPPEKAAKIRSVPGSLRQSLDALRDDHAYLTENGVFTDDFIDLWIAYKTERELKPVEIRPHPYEFYLYYDA
ncbi:MAG TPA: type I glutamate--ammonia ligase [Candidatus Rubrimentiphilum sp.]|nr:type I glutamate--ammonia ligase [Candidatus Rubrimentiphilum sp.]